MADYQRFTEINGGEIWGQNGLICSLNVGRLLTADAARAMKAIMYALELEFGEPQDLEGERSAREFWIHDGIAYETDAEAYAEFAADSVTPRCYPVCSGIVHVREVLPD